MSELTLKQRERIARIDAYRKRKAQREQPVPPRRNFNAVLLMMALSVLCLIAAALLLMANEWQPGDQHAIYEDFKTQQHRPSIEIVAR